MPPELQLILFSIAGAAGLGVQQLIKAIVNSHIKRLEDDAKDREQKRQIQMEQMRQETAKAQADAEEAKANNITVTNLANAVLQLAQTHHAEQTATRGELSNQAQSIGDLDETVGKLAEAVNDSSVVTRATGKKTDDVVKAVDRLYDRFALLFPTDKPAMEQIRDGLIEVVNKVCETKKHDSQEIAIIIDPQTPADTAADSEAAA